MATYVNDLRLKEIGTGESSGTWGTETNTNLELIGEALGFGTEAITTNADTHTTTVADGSTDPGRAMYLKYTGTLDSACTITIAPNTMSRMHFIENGTSGSQNIIISQGTGANVTIPAGDVKAVYLDGAGSGAAVVDAFASLNVVDLKVEDDLTVTDDASIGGDATITGTLGVSGLLTANANVTLAGTTPTLTIGDAGAEDTKIVFDGNAQDFYIALDDSADDLLVGLGSTVGTTPIISITEAGAVTLKNVGTGDDNPMSLTLQTSETDIAANDVLGKISFQAPDEGTGTDAILVAAAIQAISEGDFSSSSNATSLAFMTGASEAATSKMTLSSGGDLTLLTAGKRLFIPRASDAAATGSLYSPSDSDVRLSGAGSSAGELQFEPSSGSGVAMTINSSGNVGIGITSPASTLHLDASGGAVMRLQRTSANASNKLELSHDGTDATITSTNDLILSATAVGIGTTSPDQILHLKDSADTYIVLEAGASDGNGGILFHNSGGSEVGTQLFDTDDNYMRFLVSTAQGSAFNANSVSTWRAIEIFQQRGVTNSASGIAFRGESGTAPAGIVSLAGNTTGGIEGLVFIVANSNTSTERMRIESEGTVCMGRTDDMFNATLSVNSAQAGGIAIGEGEGSNAARHIYFMNNTGILRFASTGNIATLSNAGAWTNASDIAYKNNIVDTEYGLETIKQLKPRDYKLKDTGDSDTGFIAQEIETVLPQFVEGDDGAKTLNYSQLTAVLTKAIQEQQEQIEQLKTEIQTLQ